MYRSDSSNPGVIDRSSQSVASREFATRKCEPVEIAFGCLGADHRHPSRHSDSAPGNADAPHTEPEDLKARKPEIAEEIDLDEDDEAAFDRAWASIHVSTADSSVVDGGEGRTIYLVACVAKKREGPCPAKDLYLSDWFRKARKLAERRSDAWYILSAEFGVVEPERPISNYNVTLNVMPVKERKEWAKKVVAELGTRLHAGDRVVLLAGNRYREHLITPLETMCESVLTPMEGLRIGEQLRWLKAQNDGA